MISLRRQLLTEIYPTASGRWLNPDGFSDIVMEVVKKEQILRKLLYHNNVTSGWYKDCLVSKSSSGAVDR